VDKDREKVDILGIKFNNLSLLEVVQEIKSFISQNSQELQLKIFTPNPEFVIEARKDKSFNEILNESDLNLADGVGIVWASKVLGQPIKERVTGADLINTFLKIGNENSYTFFFLGGKGDTARKAAQCIRSRFPNLKIGWFRGEPDREYDGETRRQLKEFTTKHGVIDILLVAYGHNKQEKWIDRNLKYLRVKVAIGVGGVLDYLSGRKKRAPKIIQSLGLEWLFRLLQEPRRIKRQIALIYFAYLVLKEKPRTNH